MSKLLYYVCVSKNNGEKSAHPYTTMCNLSIETVRKLGNFSGDIKVITDAPDDIEGADIIEMSVDSITSRSAVDVLRHQARKYFDISKYDSVFYLDNDTIAINDINPIFELPDREIVFAEEFPYNEIATHSPLLNYEDIKDYPHHPRINTGTFCIDATDTSVFNNIEKTIESRVDFCTQTYNYVGENQQPITSLIMKGKIPYNNIPHGWVEFPFAARHVGPSLVLSDKTKIFHMAGGSVEPKQQLQHMKLCYSFAEENKLRELEEKYSYQPDKRPESSEYIDKGSVDLLSVEYRNYVTRFYFDNSEEKQRIKSLSSEREIIKQVDDCIDNDSVFYDVGANIGIYTVLLANINHQAHVVAFEPFKKNYARIKENLRLNGITNVTTLQSAVYNEETTIGMANTGDFKGEGEHHISDDSDYKIKTVTHNYIGNNAIPEPDVIKIDVEGAEMRVIKGLKPFLDDCKHLFIEIHPDRMKERYDDSDTEMIQLLEEMKYTTEKIKDTGTEYMIRADK